jgi:pSer/pThr/pTyr-binding forkhead associated (FHA) protein
MAKLVVISEGSKGKTVEVSTETVTVGRSEDNGCQVPEASVSSRHCELTAKGEDILIKDLGSTNGTFLDDKSVAEATMKKGQLLRLGSVELRFEGDDGKPVGNVATKTITPPRGGVKLDGMEKGSKAPSDKTFAKKTNKANKMFMTVGGIILLAVILLVIYALTAVKGNG